MSMSVAEKKWCAAKVLAWATWAGSAVFAFAPLAVNVPMGNTTTAGMVLCTIAIILACAAAAQHGIATVREFDSRVQEAYDFGYVKGRHDAQQEAGELRRVQ